jgi:FtsP/CotA-like multicopper oxidase with cupredoxin domain
MKRRNFLAGAGTLAVAAGVGYAWSEDGGPNTSEVSGMPRLTMPPLLDTSETGKLELVALRGRTDFLGKGLTPTIGFNQPYLGPTIRMRNGPLAADVRNELDWRISVHWHGLLVPGEHDGGPHLPISPGKQWQPDMEIRQAPATAFYHTHIHERTAVDVYAGLAGALQITDGRDDERGLPSAYGVDDLTLVLQDRRFNEQGRMTYDLSMMDVMHGFTGDTMLVNGQAGAAAAVPKGIVRLRFVNGSNARIYSLFADDGRPLHLIATDGGFLPVPVELETLRLSPGERAEVLVDLSDRRRVTLMSGGDPNEGAFGMMGRVRGIVDQIMDRSFVVLPLAVDDRLSSRITEVPRDLGGELPKLTGSVEKTRRFSLDMGMGGGMMGRGMMGGGMMGGLAINGRPFDMQRIDLEVSRGVVERWIVGSSMLAHPFHIHGAVFQVVRENGGDPKPENRGWKDTILVENETELLVRFDHPASPETPYMYHCHILEHEDGGMMGQFAVI